MAWVAVDQLLHKYLSKAPVRRRLTRAGDARAAVEPVREVAFKAAAKRKRATAARADARPTRTVAARSSIPPVEPRRWRCTVLYRYLAAVREGRLDDSSP